MRKTRQREAILRYLRGTKSHPTAEEIYEAVKAEVPHISLATVYRNLGEMVRRGLVRELRFPGESRARYDADTTPHYHFKCVSCGRVFDIHLGYVEALDKLLAESSDFEVFGHEVHFYGLCPDCKRKKAA